MQHKLHLITIINYNITIIKEEKEEEKEENRRRLSKLDEYKDECGSGRSWEVNKIKTQCMGFSKENKKSLFLFTINV